MWFALLLLVGLAILAKGYWNATRDPVIRTATLRVDGWPVGEKLTMVAAARCSW